MTTRSTIPIIAETTVDDPSERRLMDEELEVERERARAEFAEYRRSVLGPSRTSKAPAE
jgi:hypothetical protein